MAELSAETRLKLWRGLMRYWSRYLSEVTFEKDDLMVAVVAIDQFLDSNSAAINNALPAAFKAEASVEQKAILLASVALARYAPEFIHNLIGEVD